ncbi:MAG: hypothetical protein IGS49_11790 [Chlorogloeopsis fritschii C42_A2020_084]|uniref:hypothetical protein n=1 Tax=Chlorogloeopsis fritschii TaxID=1124 RepID=UPI0019F93158|nr:hypothetical protein [Chlorogloeopsis fritschii]MBF2006115.1 hypothetical protein [Chlorogloeopsis fritschii C42_A2020_084]
MLKFIGWILLKLQGETLKLLILAGVILLVWGTFAPVGTLVWWLSQSAESLGLKSNQNKKLLSGDRSNTATESANIDCYIIYLSGVGDFSANQLTPGEEIFLNRLVQLHPNCVAVSDVFPYSAANESLGGQRLLAPLWRAAENADGWLANADIIIKIRNLWRFAISADDRYGEVYNLGIANAIIDRMNAAHPIPKYPKEHLKVILIGTSGGVQVALGAASYLDQWLNARLIVVSVGGSFDGETGFESVDHVYHLQGSRDWVEDITSIVFASRWPITVASPFNQARQLGRYTVINTGPHAHDGAEGYFGTELVGESQTKYVELTLKKVNQLPIWSEQSQGQ